MENSGYTKLDNSILFSQKISAQAKILYMQFVNYSTIPNFVIRKATMIKASGLKGNTFDKYLKELKDLDLIEVHATRVGKKYEYHYVVAIMAGTTQINSEAAEKEKTKESQVIEATGCTEQEARQAIVIANCNSQVKNKVRYAIGIINNKNQQRSIGNGETYVRTRNRFNNFP